jgi:hypothetical protein
LFNQGSLEVRAIRFAPPASNPICRQTGSWYPERSQLLAEKSGPRGVITTLEPLRNCNPAEDYHQKYYLRSAREVAAIDGLTGLQRIVLSAVSSVTGRSFLLSDFVEEAKSRLSAPEWTRENPSLADVG